MYFKHCFRLRRKLPHAKVFGTGDRVIIMHTTSVPSEPVQMFDSLRTRCCEL